MQTPDTEPTGKRLFDSDRPADTATLPRSKLVGVADPSVRHEVTHYCWWGKHESSATQSDRAFATRRMALLYCCKRNSDELSKYSDAAGKLWAALFNKTHTLQPCTPFDLHQFAEMSDDELQAWADDVCNAFARHKASQGVLYRYAPRDARLCSEDTLLAILKGDPHASEQQDYVKRQALLLSDIAGFD